MTDKIYGELMDLYNSSGKEFYSELTALLANRIPGKEHTVLGNGEEGWKLLSSTLRDPDETGFLKKLVEKEYKDSEEDFFYFSQVRKGIRSHVALPLAIRRKGTVGLWIIENVSKERSNFEHEWLRIAQMIALFIQLLKDERMCVINRYLDARTNLPGRVYFQQVVRRLKEQGHRVILCAFRWDMYREEIRLKGAGHLDEEMRCLGRKISDLRLGNVYAVSEDTFAIITAEEKQEVYARMEYILDEGRMRKVLKAAILYLQPDKDILTEMEEIFSLCRRGIIWMQEKKQGGMLASLFYEEQVSEAEQKTETTGSVSEQDVIDDLLEMLERKGGL